MDRDTSDASVGREPRIGLSRRAVLKGVAGMGLASGLAGWPAGIAEADRLRSTDRTSGGAGQSGDWSAFEEAVQASFAGMGMIGAAVAVVSADAVLHTSTYGVRNRASGAPVTEETHFLVASTTKSMSSLLAATYVDDGALSWDQPVIDAWSGFRAPTDELTTTLRVRDLFGMATGITEPPALSTTHQGDPTAAQLLDSVVNLPVEHPPGTTFFYNNTVYAVGGYLPALHQGVALGDLEAVYSQLMQERVYGPVGMATARIADDPRPVVDNYATGYGPDLGGRRRAMSYGPVGSYDPVGGTLATLTDMAAYVRMQLRQGVSVAGTRVVSAANLAECWRPHIDMPTSPDLDPDAVTSGYAMGWIHETFGDGTSLIWHNGGIDGFTTWIGLLPERDIGLVVLNNMNPTSIGPYFYSSVLTLLLNRFGLSEGVGPKIDAAYQNAIDALLDLGKQTVPTDRGAIAPYLGSYQGGYRVVTRGGQAQVRIGPRVIPLAALADGTYVLSAGLIAGVPVRFSRAADGTARMELVGLETVRWLIGPASKAHRGSDDSAVRP
jgi:CubicO group peptidase (beta-lactamase class C family)